jgi:putative phosphoesterase
VRVAALYDVHGNLRALEAVLAEVEREAIEQIVCGGDLLNAADDEACLSLLEGLGDRVTYLRGNADRAASGFADVVAAWPLTAELDVEGLGHVVFCHATPASDEELVTRLTPDEDLRMIFEAAVTVVGHTHVQYDRRVDGIRVVNAGSVGMPYESEPGAYWAVLGPDVELRRTVYTGAARPESGPDEASEYFDRHRGS